MDISEMIGLAECHSQYSIYTCIYSMYIFHAVLNCLLEKCRKHVPHLSHLNYPQECRTFMQINEEDYPEEGSRSGKQIHFVCIVSLIS